MRPPKIVLNPEVKRFIKKHRHPEEPFWAAITGNKNKESWILEQVYCLSCDFRSPCFNGTLKEWKQRLKETYTFQGPILGFIHSHPGEVTVPSNVDLKKSPVNKILIILGEDKPSMWWKHKDHLIEVKI